MNNILNRPKPLTYSGITIDFTSPVVVKEFNRMTKTGVTITNIVTATTISVISIVDSPMTKTVEANTIGYPTKILLWSGSTYDSVGQWTDMDVINRIKEIYTK